MFAIRVSRRIQKQRDCAHIRNYSFNGSGGSSVFGTFIKDNIGDKSKSKLQPKSLNLDPNIVSNRLIANNPKARNLNLQKLLNSKNTKIFGGSTTDSKSPKISNQNVHGSFQTISAKQYKEFPSRNFTSPQPQIKKQSFSEAFLKKNTFSSHIFHKGSIPAKNAMKSFLKSIESDCKDGKIIIVTEQGLQEADLQKTLSDLDLEVNGLELVNWKTIDEENRIPIIKKQNINTIIKRDLENQATEQAARMQANLIAVNSRVKSVARRQVQAQKKKDSVKIVNVSWSTSLNDLRNQKKREMLSKLTEKSPFLIYIDEKRGLRKARSVQGKLKLMKTIGGISGEQEQLKENVEDEEDDTPIYRKDLSSLEVVKRNKIVDELKQILQEFEIEAQFEGSIYDRFIARIPIVKSGVLLQQTTAKPEVEASTNQKSQKDLKKQERVEKQRLREEKRQAELESKRKSFEGIQI